MASLKDVARLAGVSISTVSRVINKNIPVDEKTRERVEEAIRKVRYKPNLLAKGLRLKSGHLIGLVVPEIAHTTFAIFIKYIEESVTQYSFSMLLGNNRNDPEIEERFIDTLIRRSVDGIIFCRVSDQSRIFKILDRTNIPIVIIDRALDREDIPSVVLDNYLAGQIAAQYLLRLGHRRVGCVTGPLNITLCRERLRGFRDTLKGEGIDLEEGRIFEGDFKFESGLVAVDVFLEREVRLTAIWAQNDLMAVGVLKQLKRKGFRVPEQMSVMGMDNIQLCEMIVPSLTTISQPFQAMCEKAVEMIFQQKTEQLQEKRVVLDPTLVVRESTTRLERNGGGTLDEQAEL